MLMGDAEATVNGTVLRFRGRRVLRAALRLLAALGMALAEAVVLTGFVGGGTAAILNADYVGSVLATLAPGATFKVLAADGFHPKFDFMWGVYPNPPAYKENGWYESGLRYIAAQSGAAAGAPSGCVSAAGTEPWRCLWVAESLPYVRSPLMLVQQTPAVWDYQCMLDGTPADRGLISCSYHGQMVRKEYVCVQYPDLCDPFIVRNYTVPLQQAYRDQILKAGALRAGNAIFLFGCYLGAYWETYFDCSEVPGSCEHVPRPGDAVWNLVAVAGTTMRAAVGEWWRAAPGAPARHWADALWNASGAPPSAAALRPSVGWAVGEEAPPVPWYTSRFMTNPSCRGFPWY
eukprot:TRINITY_DN42589_c0_g1_i3.p2 TRINITY_DN42589_c0_g1~~TRINITY_DN42589_c0_g1_i3.p2  ORF type:complete len:346 (+),score=84.75 TRINITY_DN42589_c0_g1_i3:424-1461(+)